MPMHEEDYKELSDEKLIEMCLACDSRAWQTIVLRYERYIYSIIWGFHPNPADADDLFQECVLKIIKGMQNIKNRKIFKGFIRQVIINTCTDAWRKKDKEKKDTSLDQLLPVSSPEPDTDASASIDVDKLITRMHLDLALQRIPKEFQEALKLYSNGHSVEEIAQKLNISKSLAGVRVHRGVKKLREAFNTALEV